MWTTSDNSQRGAANFLLFSFQQGLKVRGNLRCGVVGVPGDVGWEVVVSVVHTNGVDLLFVTLDTVGGTNVVTEKPRLVGDGVAGQGVGSTTGEERGADRSEISVD